MSETQTEPAAPAEGPPTGAEVEADSTLAELRSDVRDLAEAFRGLFTGRGAATPPVGEDGGVAAEVQAELKKLQAAEDRKARAAGQAGKVAELEATVKKLAERKPREYRRITQLMGWVGEDDK